MNAALQVGLCHNYGFVSWCEQDGINLDHDLDRVKSTIIWVTGLALDLLLRWLDNILFWA